MRNGIALGLLVASFLSACHSFNDHTLESMDVGPSVQQLSYQQQEMVGFIHFTVNTFTDREWGYGDEDPSLFNPTELDAGQWARVARDAGLKELILTAKHHDGFCLWPSKYTEHSIKNSPYKQGKGDLVREFADSCRAYGLKVGLYLSPWDRNHPDYGSPEYITYYRNQLTELLTEYGEITEIWFDGANGGDGFYGGAREKRYIDKRTYYDWDSTIRLVKSLQPNILIFSDAGPDLRWVGNENGYAGETFWSTIASDQLVIGDSDPAYLNTGEAGGDAWIIGQCDVSIRPGWFYHESQDEEVKTPEKLMDIYLKSVGRNGVLLLNLPPDKRGLIHENDQASLRGFRELQDAFDQSAVLNPGLIKVLRSGGKKKSADKLTDGRLDTWCVINEKEGIPVLELSFTDMVQFNSISLQEPIGLGQRIASFRLEAKLPEGVWKEVGRATTIGHKRILQFPETSCTALRLIVEESRAVPAIAEIALFLN